MERLRALPEQAGSFPPLLLLLLPKTHPPTADASSLSTSPSSLGAKLLTWLPSAAPPMAMQACIPPCHHSARLPWTSTSCTCPARSQARSLMRERTRKTRWKTHQCANKVGQLQAILEKCFFWFYIDIIMWSKPWSLFRSFCARGKRQWSKPERWWGSRSISHQVSNHTKKHQMQKLLRYIASKTRSVT